MHIYIYQYILIHESISLKETPNGIVANVKLCDIVVSEFELQLRCQASSLSE